jgi:hypothetical protein
MIIPSNSITKCACLVQNEHINLLKTFFSFFFVCSLVHLLALNLLFSSAQMLICFASFSC